jgi:hypothetical protein
MLRGVPTRMGVIRKSFLGLAALLLSLAGLVYADALDGVLEVRTAYVNIDRGVFLLHARIDYPVSAAITSALHDGITVAFDVEARVERDRRFWFNAAVVDLTLHRELTYHAVSGMSCAMSGAATSRASRPSSKPWTFWGGWMRGPSWSNRSWAMARTRSVCGPACDAGTYLPHCALSCSGLTTGHA